jgi:hypothetical protein
MRAHGADNEGAPRRESSVPRRAPALAQEMHNEDAFEVERKMSHGAQWLQV